MKSSLNTVSYIVEKKRLLQGRGEVITGLC